MACMPFESRVDRFRRGITNVGSEGWIMNMTDPVIPAAYEALRFAIPLLHLGLLTAAIVTIVKAPFLTSIERVVWTIVSIVIPVLGPTAGLVTSLADKRRRTEKT